MNSHCGPREGQCSAKSEVQAECNVLSKLRVCPWPWQAQNKGRLQYEKKRKKSLQTQKLKFYSLTHHMS